MESLMEGVSVRRLKPLGQRTYYGYWGKARAAEGEAASAYHLLPYHSLDVAAVGTELLAKNDRLLRRLAVLARQEPEVLERWIPLFLALHDVGKFAASFQGQRPDLVAALQGQTSRLGYAVRHDTLGYWLWRRVLREALEKEGRVISTARRRRGKNADGLDFWMRAVTGHHGEPPVLVDVVRRDHFRLPDDEQAALGFVEDLLTLLTEGEPIPGFDEEGSRDFSWWLAGLAVLCDWLGSNSDYFPYCSEPIPLADYWQVARAQAATALASTGMLPSEPVAYFDLASCFSKLPEHLAPTPLQTLAAGLLLTDGPQLLLLEDVTGSGKTEAALLLVHRLMGASGANGIYFGLPTMATANAMYRRLGPVYRRLYGADSRPSLTLAHRYAQLVDDFRDAVLPAPSDVEAAYGDGTMSAGARCTSWLADHHKKALLAEVGVGTIDQALLGILPVRHQSLRLFGLLGKVLLVDEVHACDEYMQRLLSVLLEAHAAAGGSAILLSATLPRSQRRGLLFAFARGAGWAPTELSTEETDPYPLLTHRHAGGLDQHTVEASATARRRVAVRELHTSEEVEAIVIAAVAAGQCACWIRNTVNDARSSYSELRGSHPDWPIELFHARFCLGDRLDVEGRVLDRFGPESGADQRRGQVLIATQVVEQSLDLDFDVLITDLAPIDLLIQRAGRLHRHPRDVEGNRTEGKDRRGVPVLYVHGPLWEAEPEKDWLTDSLPGTAAVYKNDDGRLWLGLRLLREEGGFAMLEDARRLIEGVYGPDAELEIPDSLLTSTLAADAEASAKRTVADLNVVALAEGYTAEGAWRDEGSTPTRLGEPTTTVFLARREGGMVSPWRGGEGAAAWMTSSLQIRRDQVAEAVCPAGVSEKEFEVWREALPGSGRWGVLLVLERSSESVWYGIARDARGRPVKVTYDQATGLVTVRSNGRC